VMSADSVVTYSSVHSEARYWSIPSEDPYEEAAQQLFEQAPHSPEPLLATLRPGCVVGESSAAAAARRPGPTMAHGVDCSYVETRLRDTERRMMAALELRRKRNCQCYNIYREAAFPRTKTSVRSLNTEIAYPGRFPNEVEIWRIELKLVTSFKDEK
nr:hypothetical protein [Tanacetum cinerariifolium]